MSETVGQALRAAREAAGLSIGKLARSATFSESHLRSVENGNRKITVDIVEAYDGTLGTGGILVDLFIADQNDDDVRRRTALGLLGTITSLGVSAPKLIAESLRESILSAFGADDWSAVTVEYGQRFMNDPPLLFKKQISGDLFILRQAISTSDVTGSRLAAPRLMTLYGMVSANLGDAAEAARWYRGARLAADRTGDDDLCQWVRGREAFRRGYEGANPSEVLAIGSGVEDIEAKLAIAQAYARLGERTQAVKALREARYLHGTSDQSETTIYAMPAWRMSLSAAYVYALLGDVSGCESELAVVDPPVNVKRWQSQLELEHAVALARSGDTVTGIVTADKVMRATPEEERSIVLAEMYKEATACAKQS